MARNRKKKFNETQIYLDGIALNDELNRICLNMQRDYRNVYFPIFSILSIILSISVTLLFNSNELKKPVSIFLLRS